MIASAPISATHSTRPLISIAALTTEWAVVATRQRLSDSLEDWLYFAGLSSNDQLAQFHAARDAGLVMTAQERVNGKMVLWAKKSLRHLRDTSPLVQRARAVREGGAQK